jgi:hypothetical protein
VEQTPTRGYATSGARALESPAAYAGDADADEYDDGEDDEKTVA